MIRIGLGIEIGAVLAAKLVLLSLLFFLFFDSGHQPRSDATAVSVQLLGHTDR